LSKAVASLCSADLFKLEEIEVYDLFKEYKKGFPRLLSTSQTKQRHAVILFPDTHFGLDPLEGSIVCHDGVPYNTPYSRQILDLVPKAEINYFPVPRLAPFFMGLCRRFLELNDGMARIAVEQLVDGMDLDEQWVKTNLNNTRPEVLRLSMILVSEKSSRCDEFVNSPVTCFIANKEEVESLQRIPGSGY
jgi:hypothetical protein